MQKQIKDLEKMNRDFKFTVQTGIESAASKQPNLVILEPAEDAPEIEIPMSPKENTPNLIRKNTDSISVIEDRLENFLKTLQVAPQQSLTSKMES